MPAVKPNIEQLAALSKRVRHHILTMTTAAGSGHPTSSLSAVEIMTTLFYGGFLRFNLEDKDHPNNDRIIFSKGHASPLLYSLYHLAGVISNEELHTFRQFESRLEGHPTKAFPYTEVATGSLGQGLSVGVGMALNGKFLDKLEYNTYVLLGDSELAEGSNWEAVQLAAHYQLNNLIAVVDVNRLGQRGETMIGHDIKQYKRQFQAFGWRTVMCKDGHDLDQVTAAFNKAISNKYRPPKPVVIIAKTIKAKGVSFLENKNGFHSKTLNQSDLERALAELGEIDYSVPAQFAQPQDLQPTYQPDMEAETDPHADKGSNTAVPTREAYGHALVSLGKTEPNIVVLDAEVSNSTYAYMFKEQFPDRFFEMFIAEQNMVGVALGLQERGKLPFISSFAAFLTRAYDQIRVAQYSHPKMVIVGSHCGLSLGPDGATQMGVEDIAMFRTIQNSVIFYPADHIATEKLTAVAAHHDGITYLRTSREVTPLVYDETSEFKVGGSTTLRSSENDAYTIVGAGITLREALDAHTQLLSEQITTRVIDVYSIKPIDHHTLGKAAQETEGIFVVEDHVAEGGIADAVRSSLYYSSTPVYSLAVRKHPRSGSLDQLLEYEDISARAICEAIRGIVAQEKS